MNDHTPALIPAEALARFSGLELLRGMLAGEVPPPPISATMNFTLTEANEGAVVFEGEPQAAHLNPLGVIHGGWHATLLDSVMACAVHSTLKPGTAYTTVEFKVNFVRAVTPGSGRLRAEGRVISRGARIATSEGRLLDAEGRLIAHGTETCLIFPLKGA